MSKLDPVADLARQVAPLNKRVRVKFRQGAEDVMPYERDEDLPDAVKTLPQERRDQWKAAFNSAIKDHTEEEAFKIAWSAAGGDKEAMERIEAGYRLSDQSNRLMLFPRGTFRHPEYGKMEFNDEFFNEIMENFQSNVLGHTKPFIDIDHNHGAAAGWINHLSINEDGLFAEVDWTPLGQDLVKNGQYKYFSPWWGQYKDPENGKTYDRVLRGGGLTNVPFLKMLPPVQLYEPGSERVQKLRHEGIAFMLSEMKLDSRNPMAYRTPPIPMNAGTMGAPGLRRHPLLDEGGQQGAASAEGGRGMKALRAALNLGEAATVAELRQAFDTALNAIMTPEEKDEIVEKKKKEEDDMMYSQAAHAVMSELGVKKVADLVPAVAKLKTDITLNEKTGKETVDLAIKVKELTEAVETLKPKAELAERLEKENRQQKRDMFFSEVIRTGKLAPADREFWERMYEKDEEHVRKYFGDRKPNSEVKLTETGLNGQHSQELNEDPRQKLYDLSMKRAAEKSIAFSEAMEQVKKDNPDLVEAIAGMVGPAGIRR